MTASMEEPASNETDDASRESSRPGDTRDIPTSVLDNLLEGCQVIDKEFRYVYLNAAAARQGKSTRDALIGRTMMECYPGIENTEMFRRLRGCLESGAPGYMENEFAFPDGSKGWFELRFESVPQGVTILSFDITERKRTEFALQRTLRSLRVLTRCNQALARGTNEAELAQEVCRAIVDAGGYPAAWVELDTGKGGKPEELARVEAEFLATVERVQLLLDLPLELGPAGTLGIWAEHEHVEEELLREIARDLGHSLGVVRARRVHESHEQQIATAQRLEAVGRLAGGVAHDFNNLLSVILSYAGFAVEQVEQSDPAHEDMVAVLEAAERAKNLTRQLLAFSRKQIMEPQVTNLNDVVAGIEAMLRRLIGEQIAIEVEADPYLGNAVVDPSQIEQVLMNLAINAGDAMPRGGTLVLRTHNALVDEGYAGGMVTLEPGRYVALSVTDDGEGMTADVQRRIFEPFFTTKETGKGTGLGLAMVYGIVRQSGGDIWVRSEPGNGSTFEILFPRVAEKKAKPRREPVSARPTGTETVLLVEDEGTVRRAAQRILESAGYKVLTAATPLEAAEIAEQYEGTIDLLFTDMVMPAMNGTELADRLRKARPTMRVLLMSGYTNDETLQKYVTKPGVQFLGKPFSVTQITSKVRATLDED